MDIDPGNLVCKKNRFGISRLIILDNIGNMDFIPICTYSGYFAEIEISRNWRRFEE
ncbi:MAG: YrbL family protein [Syntrophales bacterium]|jgi:hypothetical protein|nr:YrbL family protein [Syntrophales bacterium]